PSGGYDSIPFTHTYSSDGTKTVSFSCQTVDGASESISSSITLGSCSPTPKSQACSGKACGSASDGCGGSYSCGSCGSGKVCSNNQCIPTGPSCSDQCNSGAQRCSGNSVQTCGDYDSDPCTEWSTTATCGQHEQCSSGSCNTVDSDGDGVPDHRDDCPNDAGATTDSDGDGYCDANEACDSTGNRYPGNYNNAYCSDRYRWVCNSDETRAKEKQNRWAPICGSGCSSGNWNTVTTESPPTSQYACRDPDGD
ncbi:MAG: hypothetical protein SVU32_05045, partial [Candidatus Nanohaloarchaea archaeon]|nr:hypothetical protein [Candidatus Nanohaloarchaea archaeon]